MLLRQRSFLSSVLFLSLISAPAFSRPSSTGAGRAGAPGDASCAECHAGAATDPARVYVDFLRQSYTPGVKMKIYGSVLPKVGPFFTGFELTARLASNPTAQAGTFESGTAAVVTKNGYQYIIGETRQFFYWTPPAAGSGDVRFYITGVGGQVGGAPDGNVTSATYVIKPTQNRTLSPGYRIDSFDGPGASATFPAGIANNGAITGSYRDFQGNTRSFIRQSNGGLSVLDGLASGINGPGTVVGVNGTASYIRNSAGTTTAFAVPSAQLTALADINDGGTFVGRFNDASGFGNAFFGSSSANIQSFLGNGGLTGINESGVMVGADNEVGLIRQPDGTLAGISICEPPAVGTLSHYLRLNDLGHIAGYCLPGSTNGTSANVTSFLADENGRRYLYPTTGALRFTDINNNGQITGWLDNRGFIMTPCSAAPTTTSFTISGGGGTLTVPTSASPADCRATVSVVDDWITPQNTNATAGTAIYVNTNNGGTQRTGTILIGNTTVTITQLGLPCEFTLSGSNAVSYLGGALAITINAAPGCPWNPTSSATWATFANPAGTGTGTLTVNIDVNTVNTSRTVDIRLGAATFTILQTGAPDCLYTVSPTNLQFLAEGGNGFVSVTTGTGCAWSVTEFIDWLSATPTGTSIFGSGSATLSVLPNLTGASRTATLIIAGQTITVTQFGTSNFTGGMRFVPMTPCRIVDTRDGSGLTSFFGAPRLQGNSSRDFPLPQSNVCAVPPTARAYSVNITVVPPGPLSFLSTYPTGTSRPTVSTLNSFDGRVVANAAIIPAGTNGAITLYASNDTDAIIDINGYFLPIDSGTGLSFYPVTPCRISDTRAEGNKSGAYGPPFITGNTARRLPIPAAGCNIPTYAQAFSLNVTAVPRGPLAFLTVYPDNGQPRPLASTLNAFGGQVVANAAIVPSGGDGAINVYASNDTDVVVDINGYFAPAGFVGALNFYSLNPCRVSDTRGEGGKSGQFGPPEITGQTSRELPVPLAGCGVPTGAQAYSLNVTAVPPGYLGFLTMFPTAASLPFVSTLNSWDAQVVANAALVPAGANGSVSVYVSNTSHVIVDINGYFAP